MTLFNITAALIEYGTVLLEKLVVRSDSQISRLLGNPISLNIVLISSFLLRILSDYVFSPDYQTNDPAFLI